MTIIRDFENSKLQTLELEFDDLKIKMSQTDESKPPLESHIRLRYNPATPPVASAHVPQKSAALGFAVKSPLVGTFFAAT
ncbi:MAG: hypothetical protein MZU97_05180 [Bacillus subtilis]|nr:hypothetical protein [Bacillus subtilis]